MLRPSRAVHWTSVQRRNAPSISTGPLQAGQSSGGEILRRCGNSPWNDSPSACTRPSMSCCVAGPRLASIFGITSPRRTIRTLSPIWMPNRSTSPRLCKVVFSTVTPPTRWGAMRATGVILPVLPVCQSTSRRTDVASSGGNFHASAQRG